MGLKNLRGFLVERGQLGLKPYASMQLAVVVWRAARKARCFGRLSRLPLSSGLFSVVDIAYAIAYHLLKFEEL